MSDETQPAVNTGNQNLNEVNQEQLPTVDGLKVLKVLQVVIGEDTEKSYLCIMEDGTKQEVPASVFGE